MIRNFWRLMNPEDIDFYIRVRANGDEKLLSMNLRLGKVHYFREELAAHRSVTDEGDSWSARMARIDEYTKYCMFIRQRTELYRMLEHFFGKKYLRKYLYVMWEELKGSIEFHRSVIKDAKLNECYKFKNIPWFIWPIFPFYVIYRIARKFLYIIRGIFLRVYIV